MFSQKKYNILVTGGSGFLGKAIDFGFEPKYSKEEALERTISYYRVSNPRVGNPVNLNE